MGREKKPCEARKPVAKRSESPGKKKVKGKDSKKTTAKSPI
jgi:nicotinic acid phosphoribosyltransferase